MPRLTPLKSADVCRKLRKIDDAYVVSFPEFPGAHTHGATYLEAARQSQTVLGRLIDACEREGQRLPAPVYYAPVTASP